MSVNTVTIEGFVNHFKSGTWEGRDGGEPTMYCNFSLGHSSYAGRDDEGKPKYNSNYFNVKAKGRLAETAADYLDGEGQRRVLVTGYLASRTFDDGDRKRTVVEIIATDMRRLDSLQSFASQVDGGSGSSGDDDDEPF